MKEVYIKNDNYIQISGWMINELDLKGNELMIYALIHGFSQDGKSDYHGGLQYIALWTNSTKQGVIKSIKSLIEKGYIEKQVYIQNGVQFVRYWTVRSRIITSQTTSGKQSLIPPQSTEFTTIQEESIKLSLPPQSTEFNGGSQLSLPNNININSLNSTSSVPENKQNKKAEEADNFSLQNKIQVKLNELFCYPISFSPSPVPKLIHAAKELNLTDQELSEYLEWAYDYLKKKCSEPENFDGYFYKSFSESHLMAKFKNTKELIKLKAEQKAAQIINCPVCGNKHNKDDLFCQVCGLECDSLEKPVEIQKQKKIFGMDKEKRQQYEAALKKAETEYPVTTRFYDKETRQNYEFRIIQIETQFGLYEQEPANSP